MASTTAAEPDGGGAQEQRDANRRSVAIVRSVLTALGRPDDLLKVTVRPVTGTSYRVNVLTGPDAATARIAHSFFVAADADGAVVDSSPAITRRY